MRYRRRWSLCIAVTTATTLVAMATLTSVTHAEGPTNVTAKVLARGTLEAFNVRSDPHGPIADFRAHSTAPIDLIVRRHDYQVGSSTGWHSHPRPDFITVT